jgi:hypothetical protein
MLLLWKKKEAFIKSDSMLLKWYEVGSLAEKVWLPWNCCPLSRSFVQSRRREICWFEFLGLILNRPGHVHMLPGCRTLVGVCSLVISPESLFHLKCLRHGSWWRWGGDPFPTHVWPPAYPNRTSQFPAFAFYYKF